LNACATQQNLKRALGWLIRNRRLSKDYERKVQSSETFIKVAMIRLILRRLVARECKLSKQALRVQEKA
jgi:hypothetical protein